MQLKILDWPKVAFITLDLFWVFGLFLHNEHPYSTNMSNYIICDSKIFEYLLQIIVFGPSILIPNTKYQILNEFQTSL